MRNTEERMASNIRVTKVESAIAHAILELFEDGEITDDLTDEEIILALSRQMSSRMTRVVHSATPLED